MELLFEQMIAGLLDDKYATTIGFLDQELVAALRQDLLEHFAQGAMKPAGIGQHFSYEQNLKVRGDVIFWLEKHHNATQRAFLEYVEAFVDYLNSTCYTGINAVEFHYALYAPGSFYTRHRDQFKTDLGRKFSLVTYLNEDWIPENGGELRLYVGPETVEVTPQGGTAVLFRSDELEHEVMLTQTPRLSIAGWLKRI
ncbi:MAG: 2OG-Fe(II) oxygenase [Lewinellaceae bacterium]|nr:2OG-Fe(II) oxygenase [Lewinellaceae bacterium]